MNDKKVKGKRKLAEILSTDYDFPPEVLCGGLFIEIRGRYSVLLHGCRRILLYSDTRVCVKMKKEVVEITGKRLTVASYLAGAVSVGGIIDGISFPKDGGDGE